MTEHDSLHPYRIRTDYLSSDEIVFYHFLLLNFSDEYIIFSKVALSDLFYVIKPNENVKFAQKLLKKNIDFLLLSKEEMTPLLAIELDDPKQEVHQTNQKLVDEVCDDAKLPLLHMVVSGEYHQEEIKKVLSIAPPRLEKNRDGEDEYSPICPNCGITMVLRFDKAGPIKGGKYYGCLNYPECIEKISVNTLN